MAVHPSARAHLAAWLAVASLLVIPGPGPVAAVTPTIRSISAGNNHTCAVTTDGNAWCWGWNLDNEVGDLSVHDQYRPVRVRKQGGGYLTGVKSISAGNMSSCAATTSGDVWCWGGYTMPELSRRGAVKVLGISGVTSVSAGFTICARTSDSAGWCWGDNESGQVGDGTTYPRGPTKVIASGVVSIHANGAHSCALKTDQSVWCWGNNTDGVLGDGTTTTRYLPVHVQKAGGGPLTSVAWLAEGNGNHECVARTDGTAWCWGNNGVGQLGDGTTAPRSRAVAVKLHGAGFGSVRRIETGFGHSCAARLDRSVWCWGWGEAGQLGDGSHVLGRLAPVRVRHGSGYLSGIRILVLGDVHTCGIDRNDAAWCWGSNASGGLGNGTRAETVATPLPVRFPH